VTLMDEQAEKSQVEAAQDQIEAFFEAIKELAEAHKIDGLALRVAVVTEDAVVHHGAFAGPQLMVARLALLLYEEHTVPLVQELTGAKPEPVGEK